MCSFLFSPWSIHEKKVRILPPYNALWSFTVLSPCIPYVALCQFGWTYEGVLESFLLYSFLHVHKHIGALLRKVDCRSCRNIYVPLSHAYTNMSKRRILTLILTLAPWKGGGGGTREGRGVLSTYLPVLKSSLNPMNEVYLPRLYSFFLLSHQPKQNIRWIWCECFGSSTSDDPWQGWPTCGMGSLHVWHATD